MNQITAFRIAGCIGALGVILGAFGAHGLKDTLSVNGTTQTWQTAAHYHLIHAVVLLVLAGTNPFPSKSFHMIVSGVLLFSGSLYLLAITQVHWLGAITPLGGICLILGWILLIRR
ncbi:MAG: DUF423 domain-containing protein [Verrucomicrobiota bacterium]